MRRCLVLTSGTGSGHNMRARALDAWARQTETFDVRTHQALEESHGLYRFGVALYNWIERRGPRLHHLYFNFLELAALHRRPGAILGKERFRALLRAYRPDVVVSVHGHTNHGFFALARQTLGRDKVRCITYCGELTGGYGFSRHWVDPKADLFIGAVAETCQAALSLGMPADKVRIGGFLLRPAFYALAEEGEDPFIEGELGLEPQHFTLVLGTGDAGANNHLAFLDALERAGLDVQAIALCGRNPHTRSAVQAWSARARHVRARALGHIERVDRLLRSASAVLARPGTGLTSEAIVCACPLIHNALGGLMPQELVTHRFCRKHSLAEVVRRPSELAAVVARWLADPRQPQALRANLRRARPPQTPADILALLADDRAARGQGEAA